MKSSQTNPLIGISSGRSTNKNLPSGFALNEAYVAAIENAGGVPVMIPVGLSADSYEQLLPNLSGLLLSGGGDICTTEYQDELDDRAKLVDPDRDRSETTLLKNAIRINLPFMGICRGIQIVNVALGGTLYIDVKADMPKGLKHDYYPVTEYPRDHYAHTVTIKQESRLASIFGKQEVMTNSLHHQGIKEIGKNLEPIAFAPDGLVEGLYYSGNPFGIALQWHPECLPEDTYMQKLFSAFIKQARIYGANK